MLPDPLAAAEWARRPVAARLSVLRRARRLLAGAAPALARTVARAPAETLTAEILPLLDAIRFLERAAPRLLAPRRLRRGRPAWLWGVTAEVRRLPLGRVLIVAPGNYPLFLAGVQTMQALAAGNAVALKPAAGGERAAASLAALLDRAGLPRGVLRVLGVDDGPAALGAGFDHVILTGSAETGAAVLGALAPTLTGATMELSGCDAVFVLPGADLDLVARCLAFGLRLNGGRTCIAPRRVYVPRGDCARLEERLRALLPAIPDRPAADDGTARRMEELLDEARAGGARLERPGPGRPALLFEVPAGASILEADLFAPWLAVIAVEDTEEALALDARCPYALGASLFGPEAAALALVGRVRAGSVCVNDLIVPTADPRLPFGGAGRSGFGTTRGAEGLLALTRAQSVSLRRTRLRPHLAASRPGDAGRFALLIAMLHGGPWGLVRALAGRGLPRPRTARTPPDRIGSSDRE